MNASPSPGAAPRRALRAILVVLAVVVVSLSAVVAVTSSGSDRSGASVPTTRQPRRATSVVALAGPAATAPGQKVLSGPLDWGDPAISVDDGAYYLYSSQPLPWVNVAVEVGAAGGTWGPVHDALPSLPAWAQSGETWSPEVHRFGSDWVLYFAAQIAGTDPAVHCIGDAVATAPTGPFLPASTPLVCQRSLGGSIDPRVYVPPSGAPYLVWKSDNNSDPSRFGPPAIWLQQLSGSGLGLLGAPSAIFTADRPWQDTLVEAPDLVTVGGRTWLFYSAGGGFWTANYAIGVARCAGPLGPCADDTDVPLLASNSQGAGPGEPSVFSQGGHYWLVYNPSCSVQGTSPRPVAIAALAFSSRDPSIARSAPR